MLTKNDISVADWNTLRNTQYLVGLATMMADASGLGTIKESIALAQSIMESQSSNVPLIRDLTNKSEIEAAQGGLRQLMGGAQAKPTKETVRQLALQQVRSSLSILNGLDSPETTDGYRKHIYAVAEKVANAASEGGILGFGGTRVSSGEQSFLDELRSALQLERVSKA